MTSEVIGLSKKKYIISISPILFLPIFIVSMLFIVGNADALPHDVAIIGNFEGEHKHFKIVDDKEDLKSLGSGQMQISDKNFDFVLEGDFFRTGIDPLNPNCDKIFGFLHIVDEDIQLDMQVFGKNCRIGMTSYTFGTFIIFTSEGIDSEEGTGRFTIITDEHLTDKNSHNFFGQLQGNMR